MKKKIAVGLGILFFLSGIAFAKSPGNSEETSMDDAQAFSQQVQREQESAAMTSPPQGQYQAQPMQLGQQDQDLGTNGNMTPEDSIAFYERALQEDPNNYVALTALGDLYANVRGDIHKSIKFYEKAIEINDRYDLAHLGLGIAYAGLRMYGDARREFQKTLMITKRNYVRETAEQALMSVSE